MPGSHPSDPNRPLRFAAVVVIVLVLAAVAWQGWRMRPAVTGGAEWIWAELPERLPAPAAFYLVRDFEAPAEIAGVRLWVQGDEEYIVHLNGRRLGSNRYQPGAPLDVYPLEDALLAGSNRLAVEVRSARGAGGFLAALVDGDGEPWLVSDRSWRVVRRHVPGLVEGWWTVPDPAAPEVAAAGEEDSPVEESGAVRGGLTGGTSGGMVVTERPVSWGRPPVGRWGRPEPGVLRPLLDRVGEACAAPPLPGWDRVGSERPRPGRATFDFGRVVTGYLVVEHRPTATTAPPQVSLVAVGDVPPRLVTRDEAGETGGGGEHASQAVPLVTLPGRAVWSDVVPRTFRHAAVAGFAPPVRVSVLEVSPRALAGLPGATRGEAAATGVAGLPTPPRRSPAEDTVRRRLRNAKPDASPPGSGSGG